MLGRLFGGCINSSSKKDDTPPKPTLSKKAWEPETVEQCPFTLNQIDEASRTIEQCKTALQKDPKMISHVPRRYRTNKAFLVWMINQNDELCDLAVRICPNMLKYVPRTLDRCIDAVVRDMTMMKLVPSKYQPYVLNQVKMAKVEYDAVNWFA